MVGDRAATYCRVSTGKQAKEEHYSLPYQSGRTQAHCAEQKYSLVRELTEVHTGAELDERPEMTTLRHMIREREVDVVVLIRLDRLARDQIHQSVLIYEAEKYGVRIELTDEEPYENTAMGRFMRSTKAFVNELERETIRYRTMNGKRERVLAGKILTNGKPLYGYSFGDTAHTFYVLNERTAPIVERISTDVATGIPLIRVAINLTQDGIPTPSDDWRIECGQPTKGLAWNTETLSKIIHHPAYTGNYVAYQWKTVKRKEVDAYSGRAKTFTDVQRRDKTDIQRVALDHAAPAIVSHEVAEAALSRLTFNKENASRRLLDPEVALLRGFVRCGLCGRKMSIQQARAHGKPLPGAYSYYCSRSRTIFGDSRCTVSRMFVSKLDNKVWQGIVERLNDPERLFWTARERLSKEGYQPTIEGLKHTIAECEEGQKSLGLAIQSLRLHEQGADSVAVLTTQLVKLSNKKQDAQEKLEHCQNLQNNLDIARERLKDAELWCQVAAAAIQDMTFEQKRMTLFTLKLRVDVYRVEAHPRWIARIGSFGEEDEIFTSEDMDPKGLWGQANSEAPTGSISNNQIQKLVVAGQLLK